MNECLLCAKTITATPSWKALLGLDKQIIICQPCSKSFKRADITVEDQVLDRITSLYIYNEAMKDYLHQYKFLQDIALAGVFTNELRTSLKTKVNLIPIPMHPKKKTARTFAHIEELLKSAQLPYLDILEKTNTEAMGEKTKQQRLAMSPLFELKPSTIVRPETYMLIDDIYTTGTTLRHAAKLLKDAGATKVEAITLIRAGTNN